MNMHTLDFVYKNWKGETATRRVVPNRIYFGATEYHHQPQWLMEAFDADKGEMRTFAMRDIEQILEG